MATRLSATPEEMQNAFQAGDLVFFQLNPDSPLPSNPFASRETEANVPAGGKEQGPCIHQISRAFMNWSRAVSVQRLIGNPFVWLRVFDGVPWPG